MLALVLTALCLIGVALGKEGKCDDKTATELIEAVQDFYGAMRDVRDGEMTEEEFYDACVDSLGSILPRLCVTHIPLPMNVSEPCPLPSPPLMPVHSLLAYSNAC